ncbi:hypothetical protein [uncultured Salegentibacter sp.]|uniref:hypothetical protein n=1 Tax=uncultured Salegentibacter sp. TaxID=259320 RepID=UPI002593152D|nr:hypothetical protein [uncultured Salegentibacter sp.]
MIAIAGVALSAIGGALYEKYFSDKEKRAKKKWQENRIEFEKYISEQEVEISRYTSRVNSELDFHTLTNMHFTSMKIADQAYNLFDYSKIYLDAMNRNLKTTSERKQKILLLFKSKIKYSKKLKLTEELKEIDEMRNQLFKDKDVLNSQTNSLKTRLRSFNKRTSSLKYKIRDNCGEKGKDWYNRLEQRKKYRN